MASQQLAPGTVVVIGAELSGGKGAVFRVPPTKGTETKVFGW